MIHFLRNIAFTTLSLLLSLLPCYSQKESYSEITNIQIPSPNTYYPTPNTLQNSDTTVVKKPSFLKRVGKGFTRFVDEFTNVDTNYIEPQHFKFQVMLQNTTTFDRYILQDDEGELKLAPRVHNRFGPYVGYSLIFLGYTLQFNHFYIGNTKKNFDLSLYSSLGGVDVFYRNNSDMRIRQLKVSSDSIDYGILKDIDFSGADVSSYGFDIYYIFNHHKHSYPAVYNQSTCQKRSAGTLLTGFGFSVHKLTMNWQYFDALAKDYITDYVNPFSEDKRISDIDYRQYNMYIGYAYNWVPLKNWVVGISLKGAIGFNQAKGDVMRFNMQWKNFTKFNFSLDGTGRIGIAWNNTRYFAGASAQIHSYTYSESNYSFKNLFGNIVVYTGFNFGKKKKYRKPGKFFEF